MLAPPPPPTNQKRGTQPRTQHLDGPAVARQLRRLAAAERAPWLHAEIASRMAERLPIIKLQPQRVLQWSAFLGASDDALAAVYPQAEQALVEATPALRARSSDAHPRGWLDTVLRRAPVQVLAPDTLQGTQVDLVWANMALHTSLDMPQTLARWQAALAVDGFVMFSCLGPDSFVELRRVYSQRGWGRPATDWWDMHDIGDLLIEAGFADPVMDQERISLTWTQPEALLNDLRALGGNAAPDRFASLRGRAWRQSLLLALEDLRGTDGLLRLSFEIVYGHAFKPLPKARLSAETQVSLDDMRAMVQRPRQP